MVRAVGILANLHNAEEAISIHAKFAIDLSVNLERHSSSLLLKLAVLIFQSRVVVVVLRIVNSSIKDDPVCSRLAALKVPVPKHVCRRVPVAQSVVSWRQSSIHTKIHAEERVWLILSATISDAAADEGLHLAAWAN